MHFVLFDKHILVYEGFVIEKSFYEGDDCRNTI